MDWILVLRRAGMFSNVNQFLESVRRCQDQDRLFVDWRLSRYAEDPLANPHQQIVFRMDLFVAFH